MAHAEEATTELQSQTFGDWAYRCRSSAKDGAAGSAVCEVAQEMIVRKDDKPLLVLTLSFSRAADASSTVVNLLTPLGVLLKPGLTIAADTGNPIPYEYSHCDSRGCWVVGQKADSLLTVLKTGKAGHAHMVLINGRSLSVDFSLSGLSAALEAFDAGRPPADNRASALPAKPPAP